MRRKQLLIFLFLLFLFSGLILPNQTSVLGAVWIEPTPHPVIEGIEAWLKEQLEVAAEYAADAIIAGTFSVLVAITLPFLELSQGLFSAVISEGFINISFTGSDNIFVTEGWEIIRGLTYIFIILGLIVIALATILRIESYQMKKTLPLFIIVALLINFTPMLCGLVIDASNIIMKHFLKGGTLLAEDFLSKLGTEFSNLWNLKETPINKLARGILLVGFNVVGGLIFLLFALLFLFRYVALWMLVILSPLALFCFIFPDSKKIWDQWLSQFIQWCFIGIPAAFTIHLANKMIGELLEERLVGEVSGVGILMGYLIPLAFLVGGFLMSLQIGAIGAGRIITGFKAASKTAADIGSERARRGARAVAAEAGRIRESYQIRRAHGVPRYQAAGQSITRYWQRRALPAMRTITRAAILRGGVAAGRGILSTTGAIAMSGVRAGLGIKRRGLRRGGCPVCHEVNVAATAIACPRCGHVF